jgi:hypothetical protein
MRKLTPFGLLLGGLLGTMDFVHRGIVILGLAALPVRRRWSPAAVLALAWSFAALPGGADPGLGLTLENGAVVVSQLEPGAEVVYFDVCRFSDAYIPRSAHHANIRNDDNRDGVVAVELARELPRKFLAVAVELATGRFGVFRPAGAPGREIAFPGDSLQQGPGGRLDRLASSGQYLELLLVRPGIGAWQLTTGDGTPTDESPSSDGVVVNALEMMRPVGDGPLPPEELEEGDVLVRVAPRQMEYYAVRIVR